MPDDSISSGATLDPSVVRLALAGLLAERKTLPPQLFYDEEGCKLFYRITGLQEYYLTRTEWSLLPGVASQVGRMLKPGAVLVEYGASNEAKAARLLDVRVDTGIPVFKAYVPIDVAAAALEVMKSRLATLFPALQVFPIAGDFEQPVSLPAPLRDDPKLGFFPGSTIGNLDPASASRFLALSRSQLGAKSLFLMGADLKKAPSVLVPAYDDSEGVTAAFNRNVLVRLNREAAADFEPFSFAHRALWNEAESRIEMHLVSRREQVVRVAGHAIRFAEGESIHTENSYKFTPDRIRSLAEDSGWSLTECWFDDRRQFGMFLFTAA